MPHGLGIRTALGPSFQRPARRRRRGGGLGRALKKIVAGPALMLTKAGAGIGALFRGGSTGRKAGFAAQPVPSSRLRPSARNLARVWLGRGLAALALLLLVGGGGFLAVRLAPRVYAISAGNLLPAADSLPVNDATGNTKPVDSLLLDYISPDLAGSDDQPDISSLPLPKSLEVSTYTVKAGDSIGSIAKRYGRNADSIISLNGIKNIRALRAGTELKIPNMDGIVHVVAKGESLGLIAKQNKLDMTLLTDANDLGSMTIKVGQSIFLPGAKLPPETLRGIYGSTFIWPVRGPISSPFGLRADPFTGVRRFHAGVDIVVNLGTPVKAAADGRVADLGYNANYGNYIILSHAGGMQTLYGHLSGFSVARGDTVTQGSIIGNSGNTGYSTGPHVHFGIYRQGVAIDPLKSLK